MSRTTPFQQPLSTRALRRLRHKPAGGRYLGLPSLTANGAVAGFTGGRTRLRKTACPQCARKHVAGQVPCDERIIEETLRRRGLAVPGMDFWRA